MFYLEEPKRNIYYQLMAENPGLKLSLNTFYKLIPKTFKKATKATDICPVCAKGKMLQKKMKYLSRMGNGNVTELEKSQQQLNIYNQHIIIKERQRQLYKDSLAKASPLSCVIIMDFKENFKIGGGPIETSQMFYNKNSDFRFGFRYILQGSRQ